MRSLSRNILSMSKNRADRKSKFKALTWGNLNHRTVNGSCPDPTNRYVRRGIRLEFSKSQFSQWVDSNWHIAQRLIDGGETPSIDRIDSNGHYAFGNIRIIARSENLRLGSAINAEKSAKALYAIASNGERLWFKSQAAFARFCGDKPPNVCHALKNPHYTVRGYRLERAA